MTSRGQRVYAVREHNYTGLTVPVGGTGVQCREATHEVGIWVEWDNDPNYSFARFSGHGYWAPWTGLEVMLDLI